MLNWTESIKNCKTDVIIVANDGMTTYYADAEGLNARQAKADFVAQCSKEATEGEPIDWSDAEVYFLPDYDIVEMRESE